MLLPDTSRALPRLCLVCRGALWAAGVVGGVATQLTSSIRGAVLAVGLLSSAPPGGSLSRECRGRGVQGGRGYGAPPPFFRRLAS